MAPMQGYVDTAYLQARRQVYAPADCAYTPFIRLEKGQPRHQDIARLRRAWELGIDVVPQVIFGSEQEFEALTTALRDMGAKRIDLNLGCPYPMQTRRGRGAAMIANVAVMQSVCQRIADDPAVSYSLKMRLGLDTPDQWRLLLPILNAAPLLHVTLHPRVASQMYGGELYTDQFAAFAAESAHPVVYNGDINTPSDIQAALQAYPQVRAVMIGRGLLARPSLIDEWHSGQEWPREKRLEHILRLHRALFDIYSATLCGDAQMLQKLKPFWEWLEPEIGRKAAKAIHKATTIPRYLSAIPQ